MWIHARIITDFADAEFWRIVVVKVLHNGALPVAVVADPTKIRERLLWGPRLAFYSGQKIAEVDDESPKALPLVLRHGHDARDIVFLLAGLLL